MRYVLLIAGLYILTAGSAVFSQGTTQGSLVDQLEESLPRMRQEEVKKVLSDLETSQRDIDQTVASIQSKLDAVDDQSNLATVSISSIMSTLERTKQELAAKQRNITLSVSKIATLKKLMGGLGEEMLTSQEYIGLYTQMLFKMTNDYYLSDDEIDSLKLFIKSENVAETIGREEMTKLLHAGLEQAFEKLKVYYDQYRNSLIDVQSSIAGYEQEIQEYRQQLERLEQQRVHLFELVDLLDKDERFLEDQIADLESSRRDLDKQRARMEEISASTQAFLERNKTVKTSLSTETNENGPRFFSRPIRIVRDLIPLDEAGDYAGKSGIAIDAQQGEAVYATAPGIVYTVSHDASLQLSRVILLHKHGYSTIYLPLSEVWVQQGDVVIRGERIGRVGGLPGSDGAGLGSLREHLYFEVLKDGEPVEPFEVLDLSIFTQLDQLGPEWHTKRTQDYLARGIDLSDLPTLQGDTVEARRDYYLKRSGGGVFSNPQVWIDAAKGMEIDPIFGICIGAAETSYRNFKSGNNIGNVGNNDRGDTVTYSSPTAGVRAVFNVLNNRYLGGYESMDQLSRYGNKHGTIYASSPLNRQKNITRCLSMIYEVNVPEQYFFRVAE